MPAGVATGTGEAVASAGVGEICCAGKAIAEASRAALKKARRRIMRQLLKDWQRGGKSVPH